MIVMEVNNNKIKIALVRRYNFLNQIVLEMYEAGLKPTYISKKLGMKYTTVRALCNARKTKRQYPTLDFLAIAEQIRVEALKEVEKD